MTSPKTKTLRKTKQTLFKAITSNRNKVLVKAFQTKGNIERKLSNNHKKRLLCLNKNIQRLKIKSL